MKEVLADTNFLMCGYQFGVDIISELERLLTEDFALVVSSNIMNELRTLESVQGKHKLAARFALHVLSARKAKVVESALSADDWLVAYAAGTNAIACTNDHELKTRLRRERVRVITLREKSHLAFV